MKKEKKIGLMGGTFDPIHIGHLEIAGYALTEFSLDGVWFMPTGNSYHKGKQAVSTEHRSAMVRTAIADYPAFSFCDAEVRRDGPTYTADTLRELTQSCPGIRFYYMVGADSLDYMDRWYKPQIIFDLAVILVAGRNTQTDSELASKIRALTEQFHADIRPIHGNVLSVSSSEIRARLENGQDVNGLIPESVAAYIHTNGLYRPISVQTD